MEGPDYSKYRSLLICILIGFLIWMAGQWTDVPQQGWQIFSVFIAVIVGFILRPFPMGSMVIFGLVVLIATKSITLTESLSGFGDDTVWLVVAAFLVAGGVLHTGFGKRVALNMVKWLGGSTLGLGYALSGAELLLGPVVPSNTARGGGIMAPIMHSLSHTLESEPDHQPEKAGRYLALVGAHANLITAAMFLTGMAANPLISKAASDVFGVEFGWGLWALGGIVPGLIGLALLPLLIHKLIKPTLEHTPEAQDSARNELKEMGPMSWKEKVMMFTLILMLTLWVTKAFHGFSTTLVAWIGVSILLLTQTEKWSRIIGNDKAWDTLIWLGGLLTMANMLKQYGFIDWFANEVQHLVTGFNPIVVVVLLGLIYFYSMYGFSMLTAHISAMAASFLAVCLAANAPPMLSIGLFAYFSCLCACLTNYSTGPVVVYFGLGYVHTRTWFSVGFVVSLFHMVIWLGVGMVWWKIIGWY